MEMQWTDIPFGMIKKSKIERRFRWPPLLDGIADYSSDKG